MIADTMIVDPNTGEVIAEPGQELDGEILYRLEHLAEPKSINHRALYCPNCGYELMDPDSHYLDDTGAFYCLMGLPETYHQKTARLYAAMCAGDISPTQWERRIAEAAREELTRNGSQMRLLQE